MGVVVNQTVKNVIVTCIGFSIGAINTLFLFTNFMNETYYGLVSYLFSTSNIIWPLLAFGAHNTIIKFYSSYQNENQKSRFLSFMLFIPLIISLCIGILAVVFYAQLLHFFSQENTIVQSYIWVIFALAVTLTYFEVFFAWTKVKLQSVFGNILKEVFIRLCIMILLCMVYFQVITQHQFVYGIVLSYTVRLLIMMVYAMRLHTFTFSFVVPQNFNSVLKYSLLILIAGSVATLLIDLDKTMIERYLPIENVAKYSLCAYVASVIIIPSRAMHQITYPLTAKLINENNKEVLGSLYKKSSLNLLVISGGLFVLIVCNVQQLFSIIPNTYELYILIVVLIGLVKLLDNLLGNNNAILFSSDYYRIVLYIGIGMAIISFVLNVVCIPIYGIEGAAIATFIAICCYNITKLWIVWTKFKIHPFSKSTISTIGIITIFVIGYYFWELEFHPIINIGIKSLFISISYLLVIYFFKISLDINTAMKTIYNRIIKKKL